MRSGYRGDQSASAKQFSPPGHGASTSRDSQCNRSSEKAIRPWFRYITYLPPAWAARLSGVCSTAGFLCMRNAFGKQRSCCVQWRRSGEVARIAPLIAVVDLGPVPTVAEQVVQSLMAHTADILEAKPCILAVPEERAM